MTNIILTGRHVADTILSSLKSKKPIGAVAKIPFTLKNPGNCDGDEAAQVYFRHVNSSVWQSKLALRGFARVHLKRGESSRVVSEVPAERLRYRDSQTKRCTVEPGAYEFLIGAASGGIRQKLLMTIASRWNNP